VIIDVLERVVKEKLTKKSDYILKNDEALKRISTLTITRLTEATKARVGSMEFVQRNTRTESRRTSYE